MKPNQSPIQALIICGGDSTRMGKPKALLNYHGMPQYQWLQLMCKQLQLPSAISCKAAHTNWFEPNTELLFDLPQFANAGPMTGLLSAIAQLPPSPIFLMGCDYPLLGIKDMMQLITHFKEKDKTTAFYQTKKDLFEPLLAIYHPKDFAPLSHHYTNNQSSLQYYLRDIDAAAVEANNLNAHRSFDTPEDFLSFR